MSSCLFLSVQFPCDLVLISWILFQKDLISLGIVCIGFRCHKFLIILAACWLILSEI